MTSFELDPTRLGEGAHRPTAAMPAEIGALGAPNGALASSFTGEQLVWQHAGFEQFGRLLAALLVPSDHAGREPVVRVAGSALSIEQSRTRHPRLCALLDFLQAPRRTLAGGAMKAAKEGLGARQEAAKSNYADWP